MQLPKAFYSWTCYEATVQQLHLNKSTKPFSTETRSAICQEKLEINYYVIDMHA